MAFDFKKEYKNIYLPKEQPCIIDIPCIKYLMIDGTKDPNNNPSYQEAIEILYSISYTIKMSKNSNTLIDGYFDYVVGPLEGLWGITNDVLDFDNRDNWIWTLMIRVPDYVTEDVFSWAIENAKIKKPNLDYSRVRLENYVEGLCVQALHIGPYSSEPNTVNKMHEFMEKMDLIDDIYNGNRKHHEIYLSDPRKTQPDKLKTILRHPVIKK